MAIITNDMDDLFLHLDREPRRFPGPAPLAQVGLFAAKDHRVRRSFSSWNYSLILSGRGSYRVGDELLPVEGPCVLTQWPGAAMDYGPDASGWREIFLIYPPTAGDLLHGRGLWPGRRPWWPVADSRRFLRALEDLLDETRAAEPHPDRLDRGAELVVLESLIGQDAVPRGPAAIIHRLRAHADARWREAPDLSTLAKREGLSDSHFRRSWLREVGVPPARYQLNLRLRHAARLLATTDDSVATVAEAAGFADPLHFSRRFAAFTGVPPTTYRTRYR